MDYIRAKMIIFCGHIFFTYCLDSSYGQDSLLSPQLEHWNIVPDPFIVYRAMHKEVDHRTYQNFDSEQWTPSLKLNELSPYELSLYSLIILLVIFVAVCILGFTYLLCHLIYHFCFKECGNSNEVEYTNILTKDVIESRVVNV